MIDAKLIEHYIVAKTRLQDRLSEIGDTPGSMEIEHQMMRVQQTLTDKLNIQIRDSAQAMISLRIILTEVNKPEEGKDENNHGE